MKSISLVLLGLVLLSLNQNAWSKPTDQKSCIAECPMKEITISTVTGERKESQRDADCVATCKDEWPSNKENKQECTAAVKEYNEAMKKNPCTDTASVSACQKKIADCVANTALAMNNGASLQTGNESVDGLTNQVLELLQAQQAGADQQNSASLFQPDRSCYKKIRSNNKDVQKDRAAKMKELQKDIEEEKKKINEANEKMKKEANEIKKDQSNFQKESQKAIQKLDVEKRESLTKLNEELAKQTTEISRLTKDIVKIKQAKEKAQFENQKTMLAYTADKINQQCKSALDTAKMCFVKASKGAKFDEKNVCANFSFSGKGTKGTAELKKKLKQVQEACFEQSNQTVSTLKYDYTEKMNNFEMDIKEKQEQITAANKAVEDKKKENESIGKENQAAKSLEEKDLETQMANFAERLQNLEESVKTSVQTSNDIITERNKQLDELKAGKLPYDLGIDDGGNMYDDIANDANNALYAISSNGSNAESLCCDSGKAKPGAPVSKEFCSTLKKENSTYQKQNKSIERSRQENIK